MSAPADQTDSPGTARIRSVSAAGPFCRRATELPGPPGVLLFGNALQIDSRRFHADLERWERTYGPLYKFRLGTQTIVVTALKDEIMRLLRDRPDAIQGDQRMARIIEESSAAGLFTAEGDVWRHDRKLVMQAMTPDVIHAFFPEFVRLTQRLLTRWQRRLDAGHTVALLRDLKAFTLDVTIGIVMGQDINALENEGDVLQEDIQFIFDRIARRMTAPLPYWRFVKLPADREAVRRFDRIRASVGGFIAQSRARLEAEPARRAKPTNMLEAMLVARDAPGSGFTDLNVIGNAITMVFAGEDTTSTSIAWALHYVSTHPEVAARLAQESDMVLGQRCLVEDVARLAQLPYLDAVVSESMRLKPVAAFLGLQSHKDVVVADTLIGAGTPIMVLLRRASENAHPLPDGGAFVPERWLAGGSRAMDAVNRTILPFGGGPRFCPGRYLAMVEIREVLSMMTRNFQIVQDAVAPPVMERFQFVMAPDTLPISLCRR